MSGFLPAQSIDWDAGGTVGVVRYGDDAKKNVRFYRRSVPNSKVAIAAGEPAFVGADYISLKDPGDRLHIIDRPIRPEDQYRWPRQWQAYQANREQVPDGTPVAALFQQDPDVVDRLRQFGCYTIQQLAALDEHGITRLGMGARQMVNKAADFLERTANHDQVAAVMARMSEMEKRVTDAENDRLVMQAEIDRLRAKKKEPV